MTTPKIETAMVFDDPATGACLQIEIDTNGYSMTIFDKDGDQLSINLNQRTLVRITNFLTEELSA